MRTAIVILGLALGACNSESGRGLPDAPSNEQCRAIVERAGNAVNEGRGTCNTTSDCAVLGGNGGTCDCAPYALACGGVPLERDAPGYARATAALAELQQRGCLGDPDLPYVCDCAPIALACSNGRCVGEQQSCLVPIDAGEPDVIVQPDAPFPDAVVPDALSLDAPI